VRAPWRAAAKAAAQPALPPPTTKTSNEVSKHDGILMPSSDAFERKPIPAFSLR